MKLIKYWSIAMLAAVLLVAPITHAITHAAPVKAKKAPLIVQGRIVALTRPPRPGSVPYKDAVIALRLNGLKAVQGKLRAREIVVFVWGMRHNKRTAAASYRIGQVVRFPLMPWERAEGKYGSYNRFELQGNDVYALDTYWGEAK